MNIITNKYFYVIIIFIIIFINIYNYLSYNTIKEKYKNINKKYTFIHIPKTAGSSIHEYIDNYKEYIIYKGHDHYKKKHKNPIFVIREPLNRFISFYNYWKDNCIKYYDKCDKDVSIKYFINILKNKKKELYVHNIDEYHTLKQIDYIKPQLNNKNDYSNIIIIKYENDKDIMNDKIDRLLNYLKIKNKKIKLKKINFSTKYNILLDSYDYKFIYSYYKEDFKLWNNLINNSNMFKKVL